MLTQYLPTIRHVARTALKYGARREIARLSATPPGKLIGIAFHRALRGDYTAEEAPVVARIESLRGRMNSSMDTFVMQDFGAGQHGQFTGADAHAGRDVNRRIGDLSTEGSVDPFWAAVLFFLIRGLRPQRCLEMGGLVGISTAYQSAALHLNAVDGAGAVSLPLQPMSESSRFRQRGDPCRIVVLEGDPTLAGIVQSNLEALSLSGQACIVVGRFAETLPEVMNVHGPFEFAFVDGHHDGEATVTYFDQIRPHLSPGSIVVFDDIAWSAGMRMAWEVVSSRPGVALAVSANQFGILRISESKAAPDPGTSRDVEAGEVDRYKLWLV